MQKDRIYHNLLELCSVPSISETNGELDMVKKIAEMLNRIDYFNLHPEMVQICPMNGDSYHRSFVYALMEGQKKSAKTIILLSHFDVVGVEEFGIRKELAFDPLAYTKYLKDNVKIQLPEEARDDLNSGDYLFGRGTMDMKFGIAADLEMLMEAEEGLEQFEGNLLFVSVPDEEANSAGMLAAVDLLLSLKKEKELEYVCCLVSEPHFPKYPGDETKYIYTGTVGKLLPIFYCVGKETHVCQPFSGLNPNLLTSKIIEKIDSNPRLSDFDHGALVPPPVCLKQSDTKKAYSVQTPTAAYTYFNFMTLTKTPHEVMQSLLVIAQDAFTEVLADMKKKAGEQSQVTGGLFNLPDISPMVIPFQKLYHLCCETHGMEFEQHMKEFIGHVCADRSREDLREFSVEIVKEVHKFCPYRNPMIVVFYAPPFYPHSDIVSLNSKVMQVSRYITEMAKQIFNEELKIEPFYPGLSDMSYLGLSDRINIGELTDNFPVWDCGYHVPLKTISQLNIPFINIGPSGRDAHKYTERLCLSYSVEKAVPLIWAAIRRLLELPE
jgi:arginine utilization protein RocB